MNSSKKGSSGEDNLNFTPSPTGIEFYLIVRSKCEKTQNAPVYDKHVLPLGPGFEIGATSLNVLDEHQIAVVVGLIKKRNAQTFEDGQWIVTGLNATKGAESFRLMIQFCQYGARESSRDREKNLERSGDQQSQEGDIGQYDLEEGLGEVEVLRKEVNENHNARSESDSVSTVDPHSPISSAEPLLCAPTPVTAPSNSAQLPPPLRKDIGDTSEQEPPKWTRNEIEIKVDSLEDTACKAAGLPACREVSTLVLEKVLKVRKKLVGDQHYKTLITTTNLHYNQVICSYYMSEETRKIMESVHAGLEEALGGKDENTLAALHALAVGHRIMGDYDKASPFLENALKGRVEVLGKYHEDTLDTMKNLVGAYCMLELWARAEGLAKSLLEYQMEALGRNHKETLVTLEWLLRIYIQQERLEKAGECLKTLVECWVEVSEAHKVCPHCTRLFH